EFASPSRNSERSNGNFRCRRPNDQMCPHKAQRKPDGERVMAVTAVDSAFAVRDERSVEFDRPALTAVLVKLLNSAHQALASDRAQADELIASATTLIRAEMEREDTKDHDSGAGIVQFHLAPWQARRVLDYIETNLDRTIRVEELAALARRSVSYFATAFRADFGVSPYVYITRRSIKRAQEFMLHTDRSLASIAGSCGRADQPDLSRKFRRMVGVPPARWRGLSRSALQCLNEPFTGARELRRARGYCWPRRPRAKLKHSSVGA